jgi:parallel beta-helix repeat protein
MFAVGLMMIISALGSIGIQGVSTEIETEQYTDHASIRIENNNAFTSANGVVRGKGSVDDPFIIEGWNIDASSSGFGIYIGNTTMNLIIRDCSIFGANIGSNNPYDPTGTATGITLRNAFNGTVEENLLLDNKVDIQLYRSGYITIRSNSCGSDNGEVNILLQISSHNQVLDNEIDTGKKIDFDGNATQTATQHGIEVYQYCHDNVIRGNSVLNHYINGIILHNSGSDTNTVERNVIRYCGRGIEVSDKGNRIMDNVIEFCHLSGIYADMIDDSIIGRNLVANCGGSGITVNYDGGMQSEGSNIIHDNIVRDNGKDGIRVMGKDSVYHNNTVSNNKGDGFNIWKGSGDGNEIYQNNISSNQGHGIFVQRHWQVPSTGNLIQMNNIIDNSIQGLDDCLANQWNGSSLGNYWSDLTGPDSDGDGIVDVPYIVNTTTRAADMKPVTTPFDIKTEGPIIPPRIITEDIESVFVNDTYNVTYEAYDPYIVSNGMDWDVQTNASWLIVIGSRLCGIPRLPDVGTYWVSIEVSDGHESDSRTFALNVVLAADNGTDPGDDPGNDTEPGDDPDNGTDPGDEPGNDTDPGVDPGNDTSPGDEPENDTDPGSDPGDGADPGDGPGDGDGPENDPDDQNDTGNDQDRIWNQETNNPPSSADIVFPAERIAEGDPFTLSASAFDPDLVLGDALTYEWYIEGIGLVGTGADITVILSEGSYMVRLVVTDHFGLKIERIGNIDIGPSEKGSNELAIYLMGMIAVAVIGMMIATLFIVRREKVHREAPEIEEASIDADIPDYAPIILSKGLVSANPVRTGRLVTNDIGNWTRTDVPHARATSGLSMAESTMMKEIEKEAWISDRAPARYKRQQLRDMLRRRERSLDREAFLAVTDILEE